MWRQHDEPRRAAILICARDRFRLSKQCRGEVGAITLQDTDSGFVSDSVVTLGGTSLATTSSSSTQLCASVSASLISAGGGLSVGVTNPGGQSSARRVPRTPFRVDGLSVQRSICQAPADQAETSLDQRPGRAHEQHPQGCHRQTLLLQTHDQLRLLLDQFVAAHNFALRLKTLKGLPPSMSSSANPGLKNRNASDSIQPSKLRDHISSELSQAVWLQRPTTPALANPLFRNGQ